MFSEEESYSSYVSENSEGSKEDWNESTFDCVTDDGNDTSREHSLRHLPSTSYCVACCRITLISFIPSPSR